VDYELEGVVLFKLLGNKKLIFLLLSLILFIALMGLTLDGRERMTWPEKFVKDTVSFVQSMIYKPAAMTAGFFDNVVTLRTIYDENAALKKKLNDYARDAARLNFLEDHVVKLEDALAFTERQKQSNRYLWHYAEVISVNPDLLVHTININLGEKDGLRLNMAVATVDGLIGRIVAVAPFYSTVQLLSDIDYRVDTTKAIAGTVIENPESFGIIERYTEEGLLEMNKIQDSDLMRIGDTVVTSGYGEVFPQGIRVGRIVDRRIGDFGITHTALIEPSAELDGQKLRQVFVIEVPEP
jgi:rod shape-determining protein MreC